MIQNKKMKILNIARTVSATRMSLIPPELLHTHVPGADRVSSRGSGRMSRHVEPESKVGGTSCHVVDKRVLGVDNPERG